mgnify:CR=1 FL=1
MSIDEYKSVFEDRNWEAPVGTAHCWSRFGVEDRGGVERRL